MENKSGSKSSFKIPIFGYHNIIDKTTVEDKKSANSPFSISKEQFRQQME